MTPASVSGLNHNIIYITELPGQPKDQECSKDSQRNHKEYKLVLYIGCIPAFLCPRGCLAERAVTIILYNYSAAMIADYFTRVAKQLAGFNCGVIITGRFMAR